jgi:hypothetical protein
VKRYTYFMNFLNSKLKRPEFGFLTLYIGLLAKSCCVVNPCHT